LHALLAIPFGLAVPDDDEGRRIQERGGIR
jgi:hypothetical protein